MLLYDNLSIEKLLLVNIAKHGPKILQ